MYSGIGRSLGTDYFLIADQLTSELLGYLRRTRDFVDNEVLPAINGYWERGVMRHIAAIEAIHTYEGTETIQTLIVGRDITGASAFT